MRTVVLILFVAVALPMGASAAQVGGGADGTAVAAETCDPPNSVRVGNQCEYRCHETARPSNDTRHTCVCHGHFHDDGVDSSGRVKCKLGEFVGQCANWFGNLRENKWRKISLFAEQYGSTPWGIMDDNRCILSEVRDKGYEALCAVQDEETGNFRTCDGDCVDGRCVGHGDL